MPKNKSRVPNAAAGTNPGANRPIGVFDSGLGGLTVMAAMKKLLPHEDIIYYGDTAHVPYGSKSKETVIQLSVDIANFLVSQKVKMIVVACNTASAYALATLKERFDVPVIGVIEPGAKAALAVTENRRVGVIGTQGMVRSASYSKAIARSDRTVKVMAQACPLFVPLVEEGWLDHPVTRMVAGEYLAPLLAKNIDTLVLGCTHYPLIKTVLGRVAGSSVRLIDSADATAAEVSGILDRHGLARTKGRQGQYRFFVSDIPQKFEEVGRRFLGRTIHPVMKVNLDYERA